MRTKRETPKHVMTPAELYPVQTKLVNQLLSDNENVRDSDMIILQKSQADAHRELKANGLDFCIRQGASKPEYIIVEYVKDNGEIVSAPFRLIGKDNSPQFAPDRGNSPSFSSLMTDLLNARLVKQMNTAVNEKISKLLTSLFPKQDDMQKRLLEGLTQYINENADSKSVKMKIDNMNKIKKYGDFFICKGKNPPSLNVFYLDASGEVQTRELKLSVRREDSQGKISIEMDDESKEFLITLIQKKADVIAKWKNDKSNSLSSTAASMAKIGVKRLDTSSKLTQGEGGNFSHSVTKVKKYDGEFFRKETSEKPLFEAIEFVTGQIYQLLMPYQPDTRLLRDRKGSVIESKEIEGYVSLQNIDTATLKRLINSGEMKGFGSMLTASYFLNEVDSKLGNMGCAIINGHPTAIKIDNDWSLAALSNSDFGYTKDNNGLSAAITADGLKKLPLMHDYKTFNHLDWVKGGKFNVNYLKPKEFDTLMDISLRDQPQFRQEVNEMILKSLLVDINLIIKIAENCGIDPDIQKLIISEIVNRSDQMMQAALKNDSFLKYMKTPEAKQCLERSINDAIKFNQSKQLYCDPEEITKNMRDNFVNLDGNIANLTHADEKTIKPRIGLGRK